MARNYSKLSPAQIQKLAKNPGERSKIPSKFLPKSYRDQREMNQRLAAPVTEGSSYTNRDLARERNATVDQKYGDALRQSTSVQQAIPQWYQNYRDQMQIAQQAQQAGYQAGLQATQALQQGTTAAQGQQNVQALNAEAAQLGGIADPAAQARAAQAAQIRGAAVGDLGSVMAAQGSAQASYGAQQYANTGKMQIESLLKELQNERDLKTSAGSYGAQTEAGIRDRERKKVLENQVFNLNVANTQADNAIAAQNAQTQATNARTSRENARASREARSQQLNKYGFTTQQWQSMNPAEQQKWRTGAYTRNSAGKKQTAPRVEPATSLQPRRLINQRSQFIKTYAKQHGFGYKSPAQRAQLVAALRKDHSGFFDNGGTNEKVLSAAIDLANGGPIGSSTLQFLRRQGIFVASDGSYAGAVNH